MRILSTTLAFLVLICVQIFAQDKESLKDLTFNEPDSAIQYLSSFLTSENDSVKASVSQLIGNSFFYKTYYDSAIIYYKLSNTYLDSLDDNQLGVIAKNLNNIGVCYTYLLKSDDAYVNHRKVMRIRERLNDPAITSTYNNIGLIFKDLANYEDANIYFRKAYRAKVELKQFSRISTTIRNIANVHTLLNNLDSAIYYLNINLTHLDSIPNKRELSYTYTALGNCHERMGEYSKSLSYSKKGFMLKKELSDYEGLINSALNIAVALRELGEYSIGEQYLDSLEMLVPDLKKRPTLRKYYTSRAYNNYGLGHYQKAFDYYLKGDQIADSLSESQNKALLYELEEKYQSEQKEAEISQLSAQNEIQKLKAQQDERTQLILVIVSVALVVIASLLYSRFRNKAKSNALLDAKNQELAAINKTKDRLFSIISHDLKSPLSSFHLITQSLTDNFDDIDKAQVKNYLETLRDSSANVRDMMDNLLKWALSQTDQLSHQNEVIEVKGILEKVIRQLEVVSNTKAIQVDNNLNDSIKIEGDSSFLEIVLRNLLSNSLKFSPGGKSIQIDSVENENVTILRVSDEGIGMEQSDIDKLLSGEIIGQEIRNSSEKGTGLGVTLVKELVEKMGGSIAVRTEKGRGTTFELHFKKAA